MDITAFISVWVVIGIIFFVLWVQLELVDVLLKRFNVDITQHFMAIYFAMYWLIGGELLGAYFFIENIK
jgi:hypothetical protein